MILTGKELLDLGQFSLASGDFEFTHFSLCTDSRKIQKGDTFLAISGEKMDALDFVESACQKGAVCIIAQNSSKANILKEKISGQYPKTSWVLAEDLLTYVQFISSQYLKNWKEKFSGKVIAISGSNGKTTTKEFLAQILDSAFPGQVSKTEANHNNHWGVPFTIFSVRAEKKFLVLELGSNHPGEMLPLAKISQADFSVTTNIGDTHLEFFQDRHEVFLEEASLLHETAKRGGITFINGDDPYLRKLHLEKSQTYSKGLSWSLNGSELFGRIGKVDFKVQNPHFWGEHNFLNLYLSLFIAYTVSPSHWEDFLSAAEQCRPMGNRSTILNKGHRTLFVDCYNANPSSMKASLSGLCEYLNQKKIPLSRVLFILGEMKELGALAPQLHFELGRFVAELKIQNLYWVGGYHRDFARGHMGAIEFFENVDQVIDYFQANSVEFPYVFLKASNSLHFNRLIAIN